MEDGPRRPRAGLSGICWIPCLSGILLPSPHSQFLNSSLVIGAARSRAAPNEGSLHFTVPARGPLKPGLSLTKDVQIFPTLSSRPEHVAKR